MNTTSKDHVRASLLPLRVCACVSAGAGRGLSLLLLLLLGIALVPAVHAQSRITSPSTSQPLPVPKFTLKWERGSASEYFLYLGSVKGGNQYLGESMGTNTSVTITWSKPPANVWIRLWSKIPVYSGYANSTVASWTWVSNDYYYSFQKAAVSPKDEIITTLLADMGKKVGRWGGQCKAFVQTLYNNVFKNLGVKTPAGKTAVVPANLTGYYWNDTAADCGFRRVGQVGPRASTTSLKDHAATIKNLLLQARKGDVIQMGTMASTVEGLHTLVITCDVSAGQPVTWTDSNWSSDEVVSTHSKTVDALAEYIGKDVLVSVNGVYVTRSRGLTLYRVRDDLKK